VRQCGVDPAWVVGDLQQGDRGSVYVLDNFDTSLYKTLAGKCRSVLRILQFGTETSYMFC